MTSTMDDAHRHVPAPPGAAAHDDDLFPRASVADRSTGRLVFLPVIAGWLAIDLWLLYWTPIASDTGDYWHVFYTSYTELFFNNSFAHWLPIGAYGQSNLLFNLMEISSTDYLLMFLGRLFHVRNAMLLFQLSLAVDHLLFLFGMYLLARMLFRRESSAALTAFASLTALQGGALDYLQIFRILSWYPLIVYFLACFFRDRRPEMLWLAGIVFVCWCPGTAYMPPFMILAIAPFVAVASWKRPDAWRSLLSPRRRNVAMMIACAAAVVLYVYLTRDAMAGLDIAKEGRSSAGAATVESFITFRNHTVFSVFVSLWFGGIFYIGLLPMACIAWGVVGARSTAFGAFMASVLSLVWFALSGLFALALFYYAPLFSETHYLYLGFYLMRAPLLIAAAAAWDVFPFSRGRTKSLLWCPLLVVFLLDLCLYGDGFVLAGPNARLFANVWRPAYVRIATYGTFVAVALVAWNALRWRQAGRRQRRPAFTAASFVAAALVAGLFVDAFQYSYKSGFPGHPFASSYRETPKLHVFPLDADPAFYLAGRVNRLRWQDERLESPSDPRQVIALKLPSYYHTYAYAQFDPCDSSIPAIVINTYVARLLALRDKGDGALSAILGCRAPKLRLVTSGVYVDTEGDAEAAVRHAANLAGSVVVQLPPGDRRPVDRPSPSPADAGTVAVSAFAANALTATVHVESPQGAWLVYADAYDPHWHAWINDQPAPILPAYVGLKAVRVPTGDSVVRFEFRSAGTVAMTALALLGALCSLLLVAFCAWCCVAGFPGPRRAAVDPSA